MRSPKGERQTLRISEWPEPTRAWERLPAECATEERRIGESSRSGQPGRHCPALWSVPRLSEADRPARSERAGSKPSTPANVEAYMADFEGKISSVTAWNCIYKLRRAAQLLDPTADFTWLIEIEEISKLLQEPRSKLNRFVYTEQMVKAGLTLIEKARGIQDTVFKRARGIRNGLMLALLAANPTRRIKNFASLEIGKTFKKIKGRWWNSFASQSDKNEAATRRTAGRKLAEPFHRVLSRRGSTVLLGLSRRKTKRFGFRRTAPCQRGTSANSLPKLLSRRWDSYFTPFVSNSGCDDSGRCPKRHAIFCKRAAGSHESVHHRQALQMEFISQCSERLCGEERRGEERGGGEGRRKGEEERGGEGKRREEGEGGGRGRGGGEGGGEGEEGGGGQPRLQKVSRRVILGASHLRSKSPQKRTSGVFSGHFRSHEQTSFIRQTSAAATAACASSVHGLDNRVAPGRLAR